MSSASLHTIVYRLSAGLELGLGQSSSFVVYDKKRHMHGNMIRNDFIYINIHAYKWVEMMECYMYIVHDIIAVFY